MGVDHNPFQQVISACENDPKRMQKVYENHRLNRNMQSREKILHPRFCKWQADEILQNILEADKSPTPFIDSRNNLAVLARPPQHIRALIQEIQNEIALIAGSCLWLVPSDHLHVTTLEIAAARAEPEIEDIVSFLKQRLSLPELVNFTLAHRARLVKPIVSYDASAIALTFVPAAEENDAYTYHHLRSDLYNTVARTGCPIISRYTVPSAHITIARFVTDPALEAVAPNVFRESVSRLLRQIEAINTELISDDWVRFGSSSRGEWVVGQETGLELTRGRSWYGNGELMLTGEGFA